MLTHYQTTNFRLFQTERICRRQFQIWQKWHKVIQMGRKHWEKEKLLVLLFPQCFQKVCFPGASKGVIVWEWVKRLKGKGIIKILWKKENLLVTTKQLFFPLSHQLFHPSNGKFLSISHWFVIYSSYQFWPHLKFWYLVRRKNSFKINIGMAMILQRI